MKTLKLFLLLLSMSASVYAQASEGIKFNNQLSWSQIKEKAKKENKYIFLDVYTTWCVPCKVMAKNIFPLKEVGDFFNKNFINVAAQFDKTNKDDAYTKSWYKDIEEIHSQYKVDSYPTYLVFSSEGNLIHFIKGGTATGAEFVKKAQEALNPETQYLQLKAQFDSKHADTNYLYNLIMAAENSRDAKALPAYINRYLATQKNLNTERNLQLIAKGTKTSKDPGFQIVTKDFEEFDKVIGQEQRFALIKTIIFDELIFPAIRVNGVKTDYGGGMVMYSGDMATNVDWEKLNYVLKDKYPEFAEEFSLTAPITYYEWSKDWSNFVIKTNDYLEKSKEIDFDKISTWQNSILLFAEDPTIVEAALNWTEKIPKHVLDSNTWYIKLQSKLLYKIGKKDAAIAKMKEAIELGGQPDESAESDIKKMMAGEKI